MDPIVLTLRASKSPPASAPVGGELSSTEVDNNWSVLKTAAEQLNAEKLSAADAQEITATLSSLNGSDEFIVVRSGVAYKATLTTLRAFLSAAEIDPSLFTNTQIYYAPTVTQPSSGLSIVQAPAPAEQPFGTSVTRSITAVGSGNALVICVVSSTSGGAPTSITDSAGGTWSGVLSSFTGVNTGASFRFYSRANITNAPTSVTATFGTNVEAALYVIEVSGAGSSIALDASGGAGQASSNTYSSSFTSTVANTLFIGGAVYDNNTTSTGVAPVTSTDIYSGFGHVSRAIFPTAGSNTATVNLAATRLGDRAFAVFRPGP